MVTTPFQKLTYYVNECYTYTQITKDQRRHRVPVHQPRDRRPTVPSRCAAI